MKAFIGEPSDEKGNAIPCARRDRRACVPDDAFDVAVDMLTREQRRARRKREVRARTISVKRMTKRELALGAALYPVSKRKGEQRPRTREGCSDVPRPCPFVSCRYHLFLDVSPRTGAIKLNFPDLEPEQLSESCCLDVADRGGETLEQVGAIMNITRERIRQIEVKAFARALENSPPALVDHVAGDEREPVRVHSEEP